MKAKRNMANIGRKTAVAEENTQNLSVSRPGRAGIDSVLEAEKAFREQFSEGRAFLIDDSVMIKLAQQRRSWTEYNGRWKSGNESVGVFLGLVNKGYHTWYDGEIFIAQDWFSEANS